MVLALVNSLVILGAVGMVAYTKLVYKRPVITETSERERLADLHASPIPAAMPVILSFDPINVNIASSPVQPKHVEGAPTQIEGKLHYAKVGFSIEIRDEKLKEIVESMRPQIMDFFLSTLGRKSFQDLTSVQGRYVLKSQILEGSNHMALARVQAIEAQNPKKNKKLFPNIREAIVTNVFFTDFLVQ